ncbi:YesL family protein [Pontibacillus salicampi]|uniref:YesL family protein n=1 Tax=Pontibacillus salicampi TaxID=1449801 RepID=A0ABV6LQM9_9BACI
MGDGWKKINDIAMAMLKLIYINVLWIAFTLFGLILLGLMPATAAMFTVIRKWVQRDRTLMIFQTFRKTYVQEFWKSNALGLFLLIAGGILYIDFLFIGRQEGVVVYLLTPLLYILLVAYIVTMLFLFPVYVTFDHKLYTYIKQSFLIGITSPMESFLMLGATVLFSILILFIPGLLPLFLGSGIALTYTWLGIRAFNKVERRKSQQPEQNYN